MGGGWKRSKVALTDQPTRRKAGEADEAMQPVYVITMRNADDNVQVVQQTVERLQDAGVHVEEKTNAANTVFLLLAMTEPNLERYAVDMKIELRIDESKMGGDSTAPAYQDFSPECRDMFQKQADGSLFSSLTRVRIIQKALDDVLLTDNSWERFALHDDAEKHQLRKTWTSAWCSFQPLNRIRDYLGEKIGMYFAFLGHYTTALLPLSVVGVIAQSFQLSSGDLDHVCVPVYCVFLALWTTLWMESWKRTQVSWAFRWAVMDFEEEEAIRPEFVGKQRRGRYTAGGFMEMDDVYENLKRTQPALADTVPVEKFDPVSKRIMRYLVSFPIVAVMVTVTIAGTLSILFFKNFASRPVPLGMGRWGGILSGCINAAFIMTMNVVYKKVAVFLNDFENHPTDTAHEDSLIAKTFIFQFVNSYISLFFIAYFKGHNVVLPGLGYHAGNCRGSCFEELATQLLSLVVFKQAVGQVQELATPFVKKIVKKFKAKADDDELPQHEKEALLPPYGGTFEDYNEMAIQFGYVVMFAAAFPIASLAAWVNNIVEIRVDAAKILLFTRRPDYQGCQDIGTWQKVFEILSILSVINNCCLLGFTSMWMAGKCRVDEGIGCNDEGTICDYFAGDSVRAVGDGELFTMTHGNDDISFHVSCEAMIHPRFHTPMTTCCPSHPDFLPEGSMRPILNNSALFLSSYGIVWVVLITEHVLLFVKWVIAELIPDKPAWIQRAQTNQDFEKELLLSTLRQRDLEQQQL